MAELYKNAVEYSSAPFYAGAAGNFNLKVIDYVHLDEDDYVEAYVYIGTTGRGMQGISIDTSFGCHKID